MNVDALERTIRYLKTTTGLHVSQDTVHNRKSYDQHIEVSRTGGPMGLFLDEPALLVDCYAQSGADAYALALQVANYLSSMPDVDDKVSNVDINSFYRNEWTDGSPCYSVSVSMVINT